MKFLLTLKHWQFFALFMFIPLSLYCILYRGIVNAKYANTNIQFLIIFGAAFFAMTFIWLLILGMHLNKKLPVSVPMHLWKFYTALLFPFIYMFFIFYFIYSLNMSYLESISETNEIRTGSLGLAITKTALKSNTALLLLIIIPLHVISMLCIVYVYYFIAKSLVTVEIQQKPKRDDYIGEFFMLWFYPAGVWIIQPRLNKIFAEESKKI